MAKKNLRCNSCNSPVYSTMIFCDQCGRKLHIDPNQYVCNLVIATIRTELLPVDQREYQLHYYNPFDYMHDLLADRHQYDKLSRDEQKILIYGDHLVYLRYRLGDLKDGLLKVEGAFHFEPIIDRHWPVTRTIYSFEPYEDFPDSIKIVG